MSNLLKFYYKQFRSIGIYNSLILSTLMPILIFFFLSNKSIIQEHGLILIIVINIISNIGLIDKIFKYDFETGILEHVLVSYEVGKVVLAKFIHFSLISILSISINIISLILLFDINIIEFTEFITPIIILFLILNLNLVLIGAIRVYFDKNGTLLASLILPFMISPVILCGSYIETSQKFFIYLLLGTLLILFPIIFAFTVFLIKEIYNN